MTGMILLAILGYLLLAIYEFRPLYKKQNWRDFWTNTVLGVFSFTTAILLCLEVKIPSPAKPIQELITSVFGK